MTNNIFYNEKLEQLESKEITEDSSPLEASLVSYYIRLKERQYEDFIIFDGLGTKRFNQDLVEFRKLLKSYGIKKIVYLEKQIEGLVKLMDSGFKVAGTYHKKHKDRAFSFIEELDGVWLEV